MIIAFGVTWTIDVMQQPGGLLSILAIAGLAVLLVTCLVAFCLRKSSAASRYCVWQFGLTSLIALPLFVIAGPRIPLGLVPQPTNQSENAILDASTQDLSGISSIIEPDAPLPTATDPFVRATVIVPPKSAPRLAASKSTAGTVAFPDVRSTVTHKPSLPLVSFLKLPLCVGLRAYQPS